MAHCRLLFMCFAFECYNMKGIPRVITLEEPNLEVNIRQLGRKYYDFCPLEIGHSYRSGAAPTNSQLQLKLSVLSIGQDEKVTSCDKLQNVPDKVPHCTLSIHSKYDILFQILCTGQIGVSDSFDHLSSCTTVTLGVCRGQSSRLLLTHEEHQILHSKFKAESLECMFGESDSRMWALTTATSTRK